MAKVSLSVNVNEHYSILVHKGTLYSMGLVITVMHAIYDWAFFNDHGSIMTKTYVSENSKGSIYLVREVKVPKQDGIAMR